MGTLAGLATDEVIDRVLGTGHAGFADVRMEMQAGVAAAWAAAPPRLLELCRVRIAQLLGCDAEVQARTEGTGVADDVLRDLASWPTDPRFSEADRAALAFTEHYVVDVASLDDAMATELRLHLGDQGLQDFVTALLLVEQRIRLRLAWDRLLGDR